MFLLGIPSKPSCFKHFSTASQCLIHQYPTHFLLEILQIVWWQGGNLSWLAWDPPGFRIILGKDLRRIVGHPVWLNRGCSTFISFFQDTVCFHLGIFLIWSSSVEYSVFWLSFDDLMIMPYRSYSNILIKVKHQRAWYTVIHTMSKNLTSFIRTQ